jgi:hypothetical protein
MAQNMANFLANTFMERLDFEQEQALGENTLVACRDDEDAPGNGTAVDAARDGSGVRTAIPSMSTCERIGLATGSTNNIFSKSVHENNF